MAVPPLGRGDWSQVGGMQDVNEVIGLVFATDGAALKDEDTPETVESWDSITHIMLLTSIEEQFGITFSEQEMTEVYTVGDVRKLTAAKLGRA